MRGTSRWAAAIAVAFVSCTNTETGDTTGRDAATPPGDSATTHDLGASDGDGRDAGDAGVASDAGDAGDAGVASDASDAGDVSDASDAGDASDVGDVRDAGDAGDVRDAGDAGTGMRSALCVAAARGRTLTVGEPPSVLPSVAVEGPLPQCALAGLNAVQVIKVTRLRVPRRGAVRITHALATSFAVRRVCDEAGGELACAQESVYGTAPSLEVTLDAGEYDIVSVPSATVGNPALHVPTAEYVDPPSTAYAACATAVPVDGTTRVVALPMAGSEGPTCTGAGATPSAWTTRTVYPGEHLVASAQLAARLTSPPDAITGADAAPRVTVRIVTDCDASACLASTSALPGFPAVAGWSNTGTAPVTVRIASSVVEGDRRDDLALQATITADNGDARCLDARLFPARGSIDVDMRGGEETPCVVSGYVPLATRWFLMRVPPHSVWIGTASGVLPHDRMASLVRVLTSCDATSCAEARATSLPTWRQIPDRVEWTNTGDEAVTLPVAVSVLTERDDVWAAPMHFAWETRPIARGGASCSTPLLLTPGMYLATTEATTTLPTCTGAGLRSVQFVDYELPSRSSTMLPDGFSVIDGCPSCAPSTLSPALVNPDATPRRVHLMRSAGRVGSVFDPISVTYSPTQCDDAPLVGDGEFDIVVREPSRSDTCPPRQVPPSGLRRYVLAPGRSIQLESTAGGTMLLQHDCARQVCVAPGTSTAYNRGSTPLPLLVLATVSTRIRLSSVPIAPNSTCPTGLRLTPGVPVSNVDATGTMVGEVQHFLATVPAGAQLTATVRPVADAGVRWSALAILYRGCTGTILGISPNAEERRLHRTRPSPIVWRNTTATPVEVSLSVATVPNEDGRYTLTATIDP